MSRKHDRKPLEEAVDSNATFLREWWSFTAPDPMRRIIGIFISGLLVSLGTKDWGLTQRWVVQLKVILGRITRSHIRPAVTKQCLGASGVLESEGLYFPAELATVCGLVGRVAVVAATMMCGRCKDTHYCSAECQKSDWKDHKTRCKKTKS